MPWLAEANSFTVGNVLRAETLVCSHTQNACPFCLSWRTLKSDLRMDLFFIISLWARPNRPACLVSLLWMFILCLTSYQPHYIQWGGILVREDVLILMHSLLCSLLTNAIRIRSKTFILWPAVPTRDKPCAESSDQKFPYFAGCMNKRIIGSLQWNPSLHFDW